MKKILSLIFTVLLAVIVFNGCEDKTNLTAPSGPNPKSGSADFTRYVAIGNSITAGYQSGALFQSGQIYAYGNLIAQQTGTSFEMPLVSDPGVGGRMKVVSLNPFTIGYDPSSGVPLNLTYPAPYNNLGVPNAFVWDVLNATDSLHCWAAKLGQPDPLFNLILRGLGTQFSEAKLLHPTFVTLWIGNNDVLAYGSSGGLAPLTPNFDNLYNQVADSIASLGAGVVVATIPDITTIPYFTTVGPEMAMLIPWPIVNFITQSNKGLYYQQSTETAIGTGRMDSLALLTGKVLITLKGSSLASMIGDTTGTADHLYYGSSVPNLINTHHPFGMTPDNPWPNGLILDPTEIQNAQNATISFNNSIINAASREAGAHSTEGWGVVDIYTIFNQMRAHDFSGGTNVNGINFFTTYVTGGLFTLDGVHPTAQAQGIIANAFLTVINQKFGANYSMVNVATLPNSLVLAKKSALLNQYPYFEQGAFKHLLF